MGKVLTVDRKNCSGCGACVNVCAKNAVFMKAGDDGFVYPEIDSAKCVSCGRCAAVCPLEKAVPAAEPVRVYAAAVLDEELIMRSASGGMFAAMARKVLSGGGVVFGAGMIYENGRLIPKHIWIDSEKDLHLLQGSKYVQSDTGLSYRKAKEFLDGGRRVLFSGTPCQIAGLKAFIGGDAPGLITVDIICHGVPGSAMFSDYIAYCEKKLGGRIVDYKFRDKSRGQGMTQAMTVEYGGGKRKTLRRAGELTAYMWEFLRGETYREGCYSCRYASKNRISDVTMGDYWGIYIEHNNEMKNRSMDNKKGVSCLIVNTQKGAGLFEEIKGSLEYFPSHIEKVARHNAQLNAPSALGPGRAIAMKSYTEGGYEGLRRSYLSRTGLVRRLAYRGAELMPKGLKREIKKLLAALKKRG